jgi:hypothetical protein
MKRILFLLLFVSISFSACTSMKVKAPALTDDLATRQGACDRFKAFTQPLYVDMAFSRCVDDCIHNFEAGDPQFCTWPPTAACAQFAEKFRSDAQQTYDECMDAAKEDLKASPATP